MALMFAAGWCVKGDPTGNVQDLAVVVTQVLQELLLLRVSSQALIAIAAEP